MKLSNLLLCLAATVAVQTAAFAEEYYVPIKKELEGMARLQLPDFKINNDTMKYTLPQDITGRELKVELGRNHDKSTDATRVFEGPLASATCMGDDTLPACVITHKNLNIDPTQVNKFLEEKYVDPQKIADAKTVSVAFISGNQPIGFISKRSILPSKETPKKWKTEMLTQGNGTSLLPELTGDLLFTSDADGALIVGNKAFRVLKASRHSTHIKGFLNCCSNAQSLRWFDLTMSTDKSSFEGTWGRFDNQGKALPAAGVIRGKETN